ncbi:MAG: lafA [Rhizobacter sp.]|nr:lafA [Rhizobacter sp.]
MLSIHTNPANLATQNALANTQRALTDSLTKLGTGFRINSPMDDAAGLQIATRLDGQTRGMAVAQRNTQNGISLMQTAEGALSETTNILMRMKDLATEAANGSSNDDDKEAMQSEYDALGKELGNIMKNTSFGGAALFGVGSTAAVVNGTGVGVGELAKTGGMTFQIGASSGETMDVDLSDKIADLTADDSGADGALGVVSAAFKSSFSATSPATTELTADGSAADMIDKLDKALSAVGAIRSDLGAAANRLDHVYNNLGNMSTNTASAKSRITDVDFATETANMTANQLLMQSGSSMLKASGNMSQLALSLLG